MGLVGARRPSISTSVRPEPRPRRSTEASDWAELPDCGLKLPKDAKVLSRSTSATDTSPVASIEARSITMTGTAPSMSARFRREPVTSMRSRVLASVSLLAASWAKALPVASEAALANNANLIALGSFLRLVIRGSLSKCSQKSLSLAAWANGSDA